MKKSLLTTLKNKAGKHLILPWLFIFASGFAFSQKNVVTEYQLKAVFIFNFVQFVEWPPSSFTSEESPIIIGVIGENPFGSYLDETIKGEKVGGHPLKVQYYKNIDEVKECHVLFISPSETSKIDYILSRIKGRNILTITNNLEDSKQEEVVRFLLKNNKTQFQINPEAAREANLILSSKLLNVSIIYYPKK